MTRYADTEMMATTLTSLGDCVGDDMYDLFKGPELKRFVPIDEFGYMPNYDIEDDSVTEETEYLPEEQTHLYEEAAWHYNKRDESGNFPTGYEDFVPKGMQDTQSDDSNVIYLDSFERLGNFESSSRFRVPFSARR